SRNRSHGDDTESSDLERRRDRRRGVGYNAARERGRARPALELRRAVERRRHHRLRILRARLSLWRGNPEWTRLLPRRRRGRQWEQAAVGTGRLSEVAGGGRWSGASPSLQCGGHWVAERR